MCKTECQGEPFTYAEAAFVWATLNAGPDATSRSEAPTPRVDAWLVDAWGLCESEPDEGDECEPTCEDGAPCAVCAPETHLDCDYYRGGFERARYAGDWLDCNPVPGWSVEMWEAYTDGLWIGQRFAMLERMSPEDRARILRAK